MICLFQTNSKWDGKMDLDSILYCSTPAVFYLFLSGSNSISHNILECMVQWATLVKTDQTLCVIYSSEEFDSVVPRKEVRRKVHQPNHCLPKLAQKECKLNLRLLSGRYQRDVNVCSQMSECSLCAVHSSGIVTHSLLICDCPRKFHNDMGI